MVYRPRAMRPFPIALVVAAVALSWIGCGDDGRPPGMAGNDSSLVGGTCMNGSECDLGLCEIGPQFPGNVCTISCGNSGNCPVGSSCAETMLGWLCLVDCAGGQTCRTDWVCGSLVEAGTDGQSVVDVCIGATAIR